MNTYIEASCHCHLNNFRVAFLTSEFPIPTQLCHCNSCRHTTGLLVAHHVRIQGRPISLTADKPASLEGLTAYKSSPQVTRYFCEVCGAHILWRSTGIDPQWRVAVGILEKTEGIIKVNEHIHICDTVDGGIADHLREIGGVKLPRYKQGNGSPILPLRWRGDSPGIPRGTEEIGLPAYCHCKAISFQISRPSQESSDPYSPYPDLLLPYDFTHLSKIRNSEDRKWWLRPAGAEFPTKYLAGHCACESCRTTSGFEIQSWAFIPLVNIIAPKTTRQIELKSGESRPKHLKQYISSPGRYREFCGNCGATVFWWEMGRPDVIDVSVGLVDESICGARAEEWLEWHKHRVSFSEEALDQRIVSGLLSGLKE